jgi:hypothetical protein
MITVIIQESGAGPVGASLKVEYKESERKVFVHSDHDKMVFDISEWRRMCATFSPVPVPKVAP